MPIDFGRPGTAVINVRGAANSPLTRGRAGMRAVEACERCELSAVSVEADSCQRLMREAGTTSELEAEAGQLSASSPVRNDTALTAVVAAPTPLLPVRPMLLLASDCSSCSSLQLAFSLSAEKMRLAARKLAR